MGNFVYVSHKDPVHALTAARELMENGHFPFVPQLNKLIPGRKDSEWENYYMMWLFRCDALLVTKSGRNHEINWALSNDVPVVNSILGVNNLKLNPFGEVGRTFGEILAAQLPQDEDWRKLTKEQALGNLTTVAGLGANPIHIGTLCLKAWDRQRRK